MTYFPQTSVKFLDSANIDAFGRVRMGAPSTIFDNQQQYMDNPLFWENQFVGAGAVVHIPNESCVQLSTGNTLSGSSAVRQSKQYVRYQPGKSQEVTLTFVFDTGSVAGNVRRIGYFDQNNGVFLEQSGSNVNFVVRSFVSGAVSENRVSQSAWNLDTFDGRGPSGFTLDLTKAQIWEADMQWLGTGRVRSGFEINGMLIYAHQFVHANSLSSVYMTTANLPIRAECFNAGATGATATMRQICAAVISEGGVEETIGAQFQANNGIAGVSVTTRVPLLSVRASTLGPGGIIRNTGQITPQNFDIVSANQAILWEIVLNGGLTGSSFANVNPQFSCAQFDTASTAISGGIVLDAGFAQGGGATRGAPASTDFFRKYPLVYSGLLNHQDVISIVATSLAGGTVVNAHASWEEQT